MRLTLAVLACSSIMASAVAAGVGPAVGATATAPFVVPCADTIGNLATPAGGNRRVVLGVLSVPSVAVGSERLLGVLHWRYWTKVVVGVRRSPATVTISVPNAWRSTIAVGWGNRTVELPRIRFSSCADATSPSWSTYAGGLYLRRHVACAPLVVSDGQRTATVRIAIDGTCS